MCCGSGNEYDYHNLYLIPDNTSTCMLDMRIMDNGTNLLSDLSSARNNPRVVRFVTT